MSDHDISEGEEQFLKQIAEAKAELENKGEAAPAPNDSTESTESKDTVLEEAIKMGYNPNYTGANKKTPEQFINDGSFFRKIEAQNQKIEQLSSLIKNLNNHYTEAEKTARKQAYAEAMAARKEAVNNGDSEAFELADLRAQQLQTQLQDEKQVHSSENPIQQADFTKEELAFYERNKNWFNKDTQENILMVNEAIAFDKIEKELHPSMPEIERLTLVEKKIRRLYPEKFENSKRNDPAMVSSSTVSSGGQVKSLAGRLNAHQQEIAKQTKRIDPSFNIETYAKQLETMGRLEK